MPTFPIGPMPIPAPTALQTPAPAPAPPVTPVQRTSNDAGASLGSGSGDQGTNRGGTNAGPFARAAAGDHRTPRFVPPVPATRLIPTLIATDAAARSQAAPGGYAAAPAPDRATPDAAPSATPGPSQSQSLDRRS